MQKSDCRAQFSVSSRHFQLSPDGATLAPPGVPISLSLSLFLLNTHTPGWMTSLFRPGFLYDRGISRILQQTSPDRWCSRALSRALSLSLTRSPQNDSLCTEHSSPIGSWRCEESDIYAQGYLRIKKCTCFAGIVAISTVAAYTVL